MAVDLLWASIGFVVGALVLAIGYEVSNRRRNVPQAETKLTTGWRLTEFRKPVIVARDVWDIKVPEGAIVLASGLVDPAVHRTCEVHSVPAVRAEFALDLEGERALLFAGGLRDGSLAAWSVEAGLLARLESEYRTLKSRATAYVERHAIADLAGRNGVVVETKGLVQDVLPWKDQYMLRLEDRGHVIAVLLQKDPSELVGQRILVKGPIDQGATGYATLVAEEIHRIR